MKTSGGTTSSVERARRNGTPGGRPEGTTPRVEGRLATTAAGAIAQPDPEVREKAERRRFPAEYKRWVLREAEACTEPGQLGAMWRREGLYSSHLTDWRRQRELGAWAALAKRRGRPGRHPLAQCPDFCPNHRPPSVLNGSRHWARPADECRRSSARPAQPVHGHGHGDQVQPRDPGVLSPPRGGGPSGQRRGHGRHAEAPHDPECHAPRPQAVANCLIRRRSIVTATTSS